MDLHRSTMRRFALWAACVPLAAASFGFAPKRFKEEGLIDAGSLGLDGIAGSVVAWGHYLSLIHI